MTIHPHDDRMMPVPACRAALPCVALVGIIMMIAAGFAASCTSTEPTTTAVPSADISPAPREPAPMGVLPPSPGSVAADEIRDVPVDIVPWTWRGTPGVRLLTDHYDIHTTITDTTMLELMPDFFERALHQYRTSFGDLPAADGRFETYLFRTQREWQRKTWEVLPEQAGAFMNLGRGGFATRGISVLYFIDYRAGNPHDTLAIAAHEGWHQYTQKTFRHQLPVWLEEGIATYMEGFRTRPDGVAFTPTFNRERRRELARAVRNDRLIPIGELMSRTPQDFLATGKDRLLVYYAQVWALTRFLVEFDDGRYADALRRVLVDASEGRLVSQIMQAERKHAAQSAFAKFNLRTGPWLVHAYFTEDMVTFRQDYEAFIHELVRPRPELRTPGRP